MLPTKPKCETKKNKFYYILLQENFIRNYQNLIQFCGYNYWAAIFMFFLYSLEKYTDNGKINLTPEKINKRLGLPPEKLDSVKSYLSRRFWIKYKDCKNYSQYTISSIFIRDFKKFLKKKGKNNNEIKKINIFKENSNHQKLMDFLLKFLNFN